MQQVDISPSVVNQVSSIFTGPDIAWFYSDATCNGNGGCLNTPSTKDVSQFCHFLFLDGQVLSGYFEVAKQVLVDLERQLDKPFISRLQRVKANLICQDKTYQDGQHHMPHVDSFEDGAETFLYYVNTTDAGTYFFDEKAQVVHKQLGVGGTGVLFNSSQNHAGSSPTDQLRRVVLNFVFHPRNKL
jgi:hypothetical protein